ncbi:NAD(P)/FAD-dependent oxidoreductase [Candidatus Fermentibacteria bacterium]|nr:NAD(P)/FAD-dependent oxidoreductase [Candidatus Fermentibacteria bacterium]
MRHERIVIIGAGPAGVSAAIQCQRLGVSPCLLDRDGQAGGLIGNAWRIENLAGVTPCDGPAMAGRFQESLARFNLAVERAVVERVGHASTGLLVEGSMGLIAAGAVILAPGTRPLSLDMPGISGATTRVFFEVRDLLRHGARPNSVLVIGGGEAACDYALSLAAVGASVTVVMRSGSPRACRRLVDAVAGTPAITVCAKTTPRTYAEGPASATLEVDTPEGEACLRAEGILIAIGRVSRVPDLLDLDFGSARTTEILPFPGAPLFIAGDARHGGLGQLAMALGDGVAAATRAVATIT